MAKRIIIKGANFLANRIENDPIPQTVNWGVGYITNTGEVSGNKAIHTNQLNIREVIIRFSCKALDSSVFDNGKPVATAALYGENGFLRRIFGSYDSETQTYYIVVSRVTYPDTTKVAFSVTGYSNPVTVESALNDIEYTIEGM